MHKAISIVLAGLLLMLSIEQVLAQEDGEEDSWTTPGTILGASFRYQKRIDAWDIMYFGVTGELGVSDNISFSGSLLFGQGPNNELQYHIPIAGLFAFVPLVLADAFWQWLGDEEGIRVPSSWLKLLLMEDTHYNIRVAESVVVSPYVNVLSLDAEEGSSGDEIVSLSSGLGVSGKIFLSDRFVLIPDIVVKRFFVIEDPIFGDEDRFGFALSLQAGYVL